MWKERQWIELQQRMERDIFFITSFHLDFITALLLTCPPENWRKEYNQFRPHSSLNYQPPAPETINPKVVQLTGAGHRRKPNKNSF